MTVREDKKPELIIFIGLPGSGKTTFYQRHFASSHVQISKDRMPHNRRPERRQQQLVGEALQHGRSVVVDNTNPSVESRAALLEIGRANGAVLIGYYFEVPKTVCVERNRQRTGRAKVPDVAIYVTAAKLRPPQPEEEYDEVHIVDQNGLTKEVKKSAPD